MLTLRCSELRDDDQMMTRLQGLFRFERVLAALLTLLPVGLYLADSDYRSANCPEPTPAAGPLRNCRDSLSSYHDMVDAKWFFIPLTAAVVMFIVNGLVRPSGHAHNTWLGLTLLGVIVFDHEGDTVIHFAFAGVFFVSAMVLIAAHIAGTMRAAETGSLTGLRLVLIGLVAAQVVLFGVLWAVFSLFVAEWVQLVVIACYIIWHSIAHDDDPASPTPVIGATADQEPLEVLSELFGPLYRVVAVGFRPLAGAWNWLTRHG